MYEDDNESLTLIIFLVSPINKLLSFSSFSHNFISSSFYWQIDKLKGGENVSLKMLIVSLNV